MLETSLFLRSDHGSQYDTDDFQAELKSLGLAHPPAFVRSLRCNGIIEHLNHTLKEQVFDIHCFDTIEEAREAIARFVNDYNCF